MHLDRITGISPLLTKLVERVALVCNIIAGSAGSTAMATLMVVCVVPAAVGADQPINIGSRLELLLDDYLVESMKNLSFKLHSPRPAEKVLNFDAPWEGPSYFGPVSGYVTVFQDAKRYRMYYASWFGHRLKPADPEQQFTCYAESTDGIHWTKPSLGLVEFEGSKKNNIIRRGGRTSHNFAPFIDTRPGVPAGERYKAVGGNGKAYAFGSADGIHWRLLGKDPILTGEEPAFDRYDAIRWGNNPKNERAILDSQNVAFWDSRSGQYVLYFRAYIRGRTRDGKGMSGAFRFVFRATSRDFLHWSHIEPIDFGEPPRLWRHELYTTATKPYYRAPHLYLAFPLRMVPLRPLFGGSFGIGESAFMFSRQGRRFRLFPEAFLPLGPDAHNWTKHGNMIAWGLLPTAKDELSIYYQQHDHQKTAHLRRGVLRTDGFVSLHAPPDEAGICISRPLAFRGQRLVLNVATGAGGGVRVAILDAKTQTPLKGFDDSREFYGDKIDHTVIWSGGSDLGALAGRPVRLRFTMRDTDLYSFRFTPNGD